MRHPSRIFVSFAVVFAGLAAAAYGQLVSVNSGIPTNGQLSVAPLFIASGSDGALWFTQPDASTITQVTTAGKFSSPFTTPTPASNPAAIAAGPDGALWFVEASASKIGRLTTAGAFTEYPFTSGGNNANDGITAGPDGAIWFTEFGDNRIARMTTSGAVTTFNVPTSGSGPSGITAGPDGALWFVETNGNKVGSVTTAGTFAEYPIPTANSQPVGIAARKDGGLWFTESGASKIGTSTTAGAITEFAVPSGNPSQIVAAPDGALWFTDRTRNNLGRMIASGAVTELPVTYGTDPVGITFGPDNNVWVAYHGTPTAIGTVLSNGTLYFDNGRFAVSATFAQAAGAPVITPATAVALTDNSGYFWFFDPTNIELVTKVLDGCAINGDYWVFAAGLTNVGVQIFVTDLQTGTQGQGYANDFGTAFPPIQDTSALHTCP